MILLKPEDYYTQRNNKYKPYESCMNTSRVMFYIAAGIKYNNPTDLSDDDYFFTLLVSSDCKEFCLKKYPSLSDYSPQEIHGVYGSWLDEKVTGQRRTDFKTNLTWEDFVYELKNGRPVMTSGRFPGLNGHAFVFIGYDESTEELIAADPWGNPHYNYKGSRGIKGYGVRYT
ncbi:MAG: hypothetical protein GY787_27200, partial [Alteromonadales bacterium]|nr:hypothetical protein [Alteromonadales bacterium]